MTPTETKPGEPYSRMPTDLRVTLGTGTVPACPFFTLTPRGFTFMKNRRLETLSLLTFLLLASALAQQASKHVLSSDELKKAVPAEYFFRGQKAPVQVRNAVGFQRADGKMTLAALVDASGYSTAIQQKYQGMLITETKLSIGGSELKPGEYGFGFTADG